jgi:gamma-glutamyltranspeptidase
MLNAIRATRGMAVAPHALAAQSALAVRREGGDALEATIAAAAAIAVVYPHMNSIGGDGFWLIHLPNQPVRAIDAGGAVAAAASRSWYAEHGVTDAIPFRGGLAANTVAGTVSGWEQGFQLSRELGGRLPLARQLADAIHSAEHGTAIAGGHAIAIAVKHAELAAQPGFAAAFLPGGHAPAPGGLLKQPTLAASLRRLAEAGLDDFYRGDIARALAAAGSPLALADLQRHHAEWRQPLRLTHSLGTLYNTPPPTQGLVSLLILGILDALGIDKADPAGADYVHLCVEATKQAFGVRDRYVTDPAYMTVAPPTPAGCPVSACHGGGG